MAGHSKWSQIKRQKGVTDQKRGALFTRLGHAITLAARQGGGDVDMNFQLRLAVDKAKTSNMPKNNIERAVQRGLGAGGGDEVHDLAYEAFGVGGVGIIIQAVSDNKNRTAAEIKHVLSKRNATLGAQGSVAWQFHEKGVLRFSHQTIDSSKHTMDAFMLEALDAGAEDVVNSAEGVTVYTTRDTFIVVKQTLEGKGFMSDDASIEQVPENTTALNDKDTHTLDMLLDDLEALDDVSDVFHNAAET